MKKVRIKEFCPYCKLELIFDVSLKNSKEIYICEKIKEGCMRSFVIETTVKIDTRIFQLVTVEPPHL